MIFILNNFVMRVVVLGILLVLSAASGFDIASVSTCTNVSAAGYCLRWQQNGTVQEQLGSGSALVMTPNGLKPMEEVVRGDSLLGMQNGEEVFT